MTTKLISTLAIDTFCSKSLSVAALTCAKKIPIKNANFFCHSSNGINKLSNGHEIYSTQVRKWHTCQVGFLPEAVPQGSQIEQPGL